MENTDWISLRPCLHFVRLPVRPENPRPETACRMNTTRSRLLPFFSAVILAGCAGTDSGQDSPITGGRSDSGPARTVAPLPDSPNWVSGPVYHASGRLRASFGSGQRVRYCSYVVDREGNGTAVVTVTKPDGSIRKLFFTDGRGTGTDAVGNGADAFSARKTGGTSVIRSGAEVYTVPDTVIYGG